MCSTVDIILNGRTQSAYLLILYALNHHIRVRLAQHMYTMYIMCIMQCVQDHKHVRFVQHMHGAQCVQSKIQL
jgi:hypothetical protein